MRDFFDKYKHLIIFGNVVLAIITCLAYLAGFSSPFQNELLAIIALSYAVQLLGHIFFVLFWAWSKSKMVILSACFIILELFVTNQFFNISFGGDKAPENKSISIASFNMQFTKDLYDQLPVASFYKKVEALDHIDVLCTQELGYKSSIIVDSLLSFPYRYKPDHSFVAIFSKFPIIRKGIIDQGFSGANLCIWADVDTGSDTLRVYNTHLESNRFDGVVPTVIYQDREEKISTSVIWGLLKNYTRFSEMRYDQAGLIAQHKNQSPYQSVICGDFNDLPLSSVLKSISSNMKDTYKEKGHGIGSTLESNIPGMRIDYILVEEDTDVLSHEIVKGLYSDHYLVNSKIILKGDSD